jgi:hypothetical protein
MADGINDNDERLFGSVIRIISGTCRLLACTLL